jgi:hypothetical protein
VFEEMLLYFFLGLQAMSGLGDLVKVFDPSWSKEFRPALVAIEPRE